MRYLAILFSLAAVSILIPATTPYTGPVFTDVTAQAGIRFVHNSGRAGKKYLPETLGSGCAFLDVDGDGWPDILLINRRTGRRGRAPCLPLSQQSHGTFTDITAGSGLDVEMYGMGVALRTTITTAATTSISPRWKATACATTG
jgi:hypothetical protein